MRKTIKIIEFVLIFLFVVATAMRIFEIAGGGVITVLSLCALGLFYLAFGFAIFSNIKFGKEKESTTEKQNPIFIIAGVIIGIVASFACFGTLFKIMLWPGSGMLLALGTIAFALFLLAFVAVKLATKSSDSFYTTMIIRTGIFFLVVSSLYSILTNTWIDIIHRKQPEYAEMMKESLANPTDEAIRIRMDNYRDSLYDEKYLQK